MFNLFYSCRERSRRQPNELHDPIENETIGQRNGNGSDVHCRRGDVQTIKVGSCLDPAADETAVPRLGRLLVQFVDDGSHFHHDP